MLERDLMHAFYHGAFPDDDFHGGPGEWQSRMMDKNGGIMPPILYAFLILCATQACAATKYVIAAELVLMCVCVCVCAKFHAAFATLNALDTRCRANHGFRSPFSLRVQTSRCRGVEFHSRARCLVHVEDGMRPRCDGTLLCFES